MASSSRTAATFSTLPEISSQFIIHAENRKYDHQYANMYFVRLTKLRGAVENRAHKRWKNAQGSPTFIDRVLNISAGKMSYVVGTLYMDMPLKPNVLKDISEDQWITAPPPREKFFSTDDDIMLEDESGRVRLVGERLAKFRLVTGIIIGVLGFETSAGDFEVIDVVFPGIPPRQPKVMDVKEDKGSWVAIVSGLDVGSSEDDITNMAKELMAEWVVGEAGGSDDKELSTAISRLIVAGNSLSPPSREATNLKKGAKVYGYDASSYSSKPLEELDDLLSDFASSIPVHLIPGPLDPAGATLPQQPLPRGMFGKSSAWSEFRTESNPCWLEIGGKKILATAGQTLDDILKYVDTDDRQKLAEDTLKWRHMAPTAPDTLWCHPFDETDPFILNHAPDIYIIGNQPSFSTSLTSEDDDHPTRVILVPRFSVTGELVLVNTATLETKVVSFESLKSNASAVEEDAKMINGN